MKIIYTFFAILIFVTIGCDTKENPTQGTVSSRTIAIANSGGGAGTLSLLDPATGELQKDVIGVGNTPNDLLWHNGNLYVLNSISNDMNIFTTLSDNALVLVKTVMLNTLGGNSPQYGAIAWGRMYISNFVSNDVTVYDLQTDTPIKEIAVGKGPADMLTVGTDIWVAVSGFDPIGGVYADPGWVFIISADSNRVTDSIAVGVNPQYIALDNAGRVHIICTGDFNAKTGKAYIVTPGDRAIQQVVDLGGSPGEVVITSTGIATVAAGGWAVAGSVYRYNATTGEVLNGAANPVAVHISASRLLATGGDTVFVACSEWNGGSYVDQLVGTQRVSFVQPGDGPGAMVLIE